MRQNLDRLWQEIYPDGGRASVDPAEIKLRVNMALDKPERRFCMRKQVCAAIICAALVLALAGTALAVYCRNTALTWFEGDTALVEPSVQELDEVMEKDGWRVRVDSALSDEYNTILGITMEALTDETWDILNDKLFHPLWIINIHRKNPSPTSMSLTCKSDFSQETERTRSFSIRLEGVGVPSTLHLWFHDSPEDAMVVELVDQVESLLVTAEPISDEAEYFIRSCTLNALGVVLEVECAQLGPGFQAVDFCFRMADGSLKTLSQMRGDVVNLSMAWTGVPPFTVYRYTASFDSVFDPAEVSGVLMNGREYSFREPEKVVPAEIPETMRSFRTPFVERNEAFYFSASDVCRQIGAVIEEDRAAYVIRYLDRELVITPGNSSVLLDGEAKEIGFPALEEDGELLLPGKFFSLMGLNGSFYYLEDGPEHTPDSWLVVP